MLDLSRVLAGPWSTQVLADYGATVIKVERPGTGDDTRSWGPPFVDSGDAAYFQCANRGKASITIDLTTDKGANLVRQLASTSHILVENYKHGGLAKYGLDYRALAAVNPALVYCSITGFGQTGPLADRPGYDYLIQAMGGLMSVTGQPDGTPGAAPMKTGVAIADLFTGMYAVTAILAALRHAEATGQGGHVDIALFDCQLAMMANQAASFLATGTSPTRLGNAHPNIAPYQVFAVEDGHMVIAVGNDRQFAALCAMLSRPDLATDPRFATNPARVENRAALDEVLSPLFRQDNAQSWIAQCETAGVPCGPINTVGQALTSAQAKARDMVITHDNGTRTVASPVRLSTPEHARTGESNTPDMVTAKTAPPPPVLGVHTDDVLQNLLGLSPSDIAQLRHEGIV